MLTVPQLKKLIQAHNVLSKIKLPPKADRTALLKLITDNNYVLDEDKKVIRPLVKRGKQITLKKAEEVVPKSKPRKPKTQKDKLVKDIEKELRKLEIKDLEKILKDLKK
tara:strand:- start:3189 stop:3515 length:327 start_codon:yes stop_codon:yes gene_type:complete